MKRKNLVQSENIYLLSIDYSILFNHHYNLVEIYNVVGTLLDFLSRMETWKDIRQKHNGENRAKSQIF